MEENFIHYKINNEIFCNQISFVVCPARASDSAEFDKIISISRGLTSNVSFANIMNQIDANKSLTVNRRNKHEKGSRGRRL